MRVLYILFYSIQLIYIYYIYVNVYKYIPSFCVHDIHAHMLKMFHVHFVGFESRNIQWLDKAEAHMYKALQ